MPSHDPVVRALACKIAANERHHPSADTGELRRELRKASLAEGIQREAESDPPLSLEQRSELAILLLRSSGGADAA
jgi:hypothetical protein